MLGRLWFILILFFFVLMNVLLWRNEIRGRGRLGNPIPVEIVREKILTAPDNSTLEVRRRGQRIGVIHWVPNIGEELTTGKVMAEDLPPEGMVRQVSGYSIDIDGNFAEAAGHSLRFHTRLDFATNHTWKRMDLRLNIHPAVYVVGADANDRTLSLNVQSEQRTLRGSWTFDELRDPRRLLRQLGGPLGELVVPLELLPSLEPSTNSPPVQLQWEARNDRLSLGNARMRVYRVEVRWLDRFEGVVWISPVGEILRVELPGEIVLLNDALSSL